MEDLAHPPGSQDYPDVGLREDGVTAGRQEFQDRRVGFHRDVTRVPGGQQDREDQDSGS